VLPPVVTALLAVTLALAAGCGGSDSSAEPSPETTVTTKPNPTPPAESSPFTYDRTAALEVRDLGRVNSDYPIVVRDLSFQSGEDTIEGFLAVPPGEGRRPAVVYLPGAGGDRGQLLVQAVWLAGRGAVTLSLTPPSSTATAPEGQTPSDALQSQHDLAVRDVVAVRRAVDLLAERPDVDPEKVGFLGWSLGARTGSVVAGVEPRIDAFVLMSAGATSVEEYAKQAPADLRADIRRLLGEVDPLRYVARARPGTLLLQNGRTDEVVPRKALDELAAAAPKGTTVRWYAAGHELDVPAQREQLDWLTEKLAITGPAIRGARTGP
jgi:dienelactone hydrolase